MGGRGRGGQGAGAGGEGQVCAGPERGGTGRGGVGWGRGGSGEVCWVMLGVPPPFSYRNTVRFIIFSESAHLSFFSAHSCQKRPSPQEVG